MKTLTSFFCTATDTLLPYKSRGKRTSKRERVRLNSELGTIKSRKRKQVTYYYYTTDDDEYIGERR
jgi:hypothetical protein